MDVPWHIQRMRTDSGMNYQRLASLVKLGDFLPEGNIVECGVMNGGSLAALSYNNSREVWGFDSWNGCPEPDPELDYQIQTKRKAEKGLCEGDKERVIKLWGDLGLEPERLHLVTGDIRETLKFNSLSLYPIAVLHVDVDYYDSTLFCLTHLYGMVKPGAWVICDDYNYWSGANRAVHEFVAKKCPEVTLERPHTNGVWWKKI